MVTCFRQIQAGTQEPSHQSGPHLNWPLTFWHRVVILRASTLSCDSAGTLCLQLLHCPESPPAVSGCSWIFHQNVATFFTLCLTRPQMLFCWLVHTRFCDALLPTPGFFFEIKDSVSGHCFVATNLHLENSFEVKFVCSLQL